MKSNIIFRMVAYTDAAGKYSVDAPRNGNEDNFFFAYDLSKDAPFKGEPDVDTQMSECGLLMVVADGMGGMNAGEVASQIAVDTVAEFFAPGKITPEFAKDHQKRKKYMEHVISEADIRIKKDSKHDSEHKGMGSTIIMAWIVGDELTLSWCGDSRAYRYNPACGIEPLSKDHSYVQELVDKGLIKYEDTFDHPQGNIVTRSLGDISKKAIPETKLFKIYNNDIILLCSDGLSGVLRDKKTYDMDGELIEGDNLEDIISTNRSSLKECREALWKAAEKADWYDNVTAVLCEIKSGAGTYVLEKKDEISPKSQVTQQNLINKTFKGINIRLSPKGIIIATIGLILFTCVIFFSAWKLFVMHQERNQVEVEDSTSVNIVEGGYSKIPNVDFENSKAELQKRLNKILTDLKIQHGDAIIQQLEDDLKNADDTIKLKNIKSKVELWEEKIPIIDKVKLALAKNSSSQMTRKKLEDLLGIIYKSNSIDDNEWNNTLNRIINNSNPTKPEDKIKEDNETPSDLTPVDDSSYEDESIERGFTIQKTDTYKSFCANVESQIKGYRVYIIKTRVGGKTVDENFFNEFRNYSKRDVIVRLVKK